MCRIVASDMTTLLGVAGTLSIGGTAGVGASADVGAITEATHAYIAASADVDADGNLQIDATSRESITSIAPGGSIGGSAGIAGSAGVEVLSVETIAYIGENARVDADGSVVVSAEDVSDMDILAGNVSVSGSASVGAAAGVPVVNKNTEAYIAANATVNGRGNGAAVNVDTGGFVAGTPGSGQVTVPPSDSGFKGNNDFDQDGSSDLPSLTQNRNWVPETRAFHGVAVTAVNHDGVGSIGVSGGAGGAVAVNIGGSVHVINTSTTAHVDQGAQINVDNTGAADAQSVLVAAGNDFRHMGIAGALSGSGTVAVAPGVAVVVANLDTEAFIDDGTTVNAKSDVLVTAKGKEDIVLVAAGVAVSGTVSVGGSVGVSVLDINTSAHIGTDATSDAQGAKVHADGSVLVSATDDTSITSIAGSAGIGIAAAGIGASVSVPVTTKHTNAFIASHAQVDGMADAAELAVRDP